MIRQNGTAVPTTCGNCTVEERWFLHHILHRGIFRRICTNCVLKLNSQSFCPTCFLIYSPSPPSSSTSNGLISCFKCYSLSHNSCVGVNPPHPYLCPLCVNPSSPVFSLKKGKEVGFDNEEGRVVDMKAAKVLLTAAKIAAASLNRAALAARVEAERRAKEAAFTRKRAREAIEHVAYLTAREKLQKKDVVPLLHSNGPGFVGGNVINRGGNQCQSMVLAALPAEEEIVGNADRLDGSSEVLVALNAVDLKGKSPITGLPAGKSGSAMAAEMNGVAMETPSSATRGELVRNHSGATRVEDGKPGEVERENGQREMVNSGMVSGKDQDQRMVNSNGGKANGSHPQL
ncbi:hypothetical protein P3S67_019130 [Capsicum chacoense]|uniref:Zinc finger PHD-type domain-containing protein n=1 Tax=Capsicum annuum TaxID=4072 RepID=A0A1U8DV19_CAPAN|nr:uncharacterized protein LOC107839747 [Capsicum annuum]KAF3654684.1 putative pentatricopeptide repeat-containing protein, mitochondrial-like isoform X1 [Capsicum annuum]PHT62552.1 hypothetical protein T459_33612 [Capsicum annuum]